MQMRRRWWRACGEDEGAALLWTWVAVRMAEQELQMRRRWWRWTSGSSRTQRHAIVACTWAWKETSSSTALHLRARPTVKWYNPQGHLTCRWMAIGISPKNSYCMASLHFFNAGVYICKFSTLCNILTLCVVP